MKVIEKNNWDFTLFDVDGDYIISVVFYASRADYSRSFKIDKDKQKIDMESLKKLAKDIRHNYEEYKKLEVTPSL